jgi:hypothetical protein
MTIAEFRNKATSKELKSLTASEIDNIVSCSKYDGGAHGLNVCVLDLVNLTAKNITGESYSFNFRYDENYIRVPKLDDRADAYNFLLKLKVAA